MGALRRSGGGADGRQRRVDRANADGVPGRWVLRTVDRIVSRCDVPRQRRKYQIQPFYISAASRRARFIRRRLRLRLKDEGQRLKCALRLALSVLPRQPQPIVLADRFDAVFGRFR
jgi:hypothetical protein